MLMSFLEQSSLLRRRKYFPLHLGANCSGYREQLPLHSAKGISTLQIIYPELERKKENQLGMHQAMYQE